MPPLVASILLVLAGFACIFLEFLIPSTGVIAIISGTLLVSAVVVAFSVGVGTGIIVLIVILLALPFAIMFMIQIWPNTPFGKLVFSRLPTREEVEPAPELTESLESLVGREGIARSKLLPAGSITIDGKHYDAVSDGMPIEKDQPVKVIAVKARRIFVRPVLQEQTTHQAESVDDPLNQSIESLGLESLDDPLTE